MPAPTASHDRRRMSIFGDIDGQNGSGRAARYLNRISSLTAIEEGKRARDKLLALRTGSSVIDVGCGLGIDVRRMAVIVGPKGRAVGADVSGSLLEEARHLHNGELVEWCVADACRLPYPNGEFEAVRIERVLEHLADPEAAVAEAMRVARPNGLVCLCEPDWGTLVVGGLDRESSDAVRDVMSRTVRHPNVGRDLTGLVHAVGTPRSVDVYAEVVTVEDHTTMMALAPTSSTADEISAPDLRDADERGGLIAMLTMVTVLVRC